MFDARRRVPRQRRSEATRDAIVEAAGRAFAEHGFEGATIARIAEIAGVSPGSLYQYFASKDALVTAIFERESAEQHRHVLSLVAQMGTDDVRALLHAFVDWSVAVFEAKRPLYRVLLREVPRVSGLAPTLAVDHTAARSLRLLLEVGKRRVRAHDLDAAAMLVVRSFRYNTIGVVNEAFASEKARTAFVDELADMLALYLIAERPWRQR